MPKARILNLLAIGASALLGFAASAHATPVNLLTNGSFETGNTSGWTASGPGANINYGAYRTGTGDYVNPENGNYFALTGSPYASMLSQGFNDIAGDTLSVTGWFYSEVYGNTCCSSFSMSFDGGTLVSQNRTSSLYWTPFSYDVIATGHDTLSVSIASNNYTTAMDNFSVIDTSPAPSAGSGSSSTSVPEPAGLSLIAFALLGAAALKRKHIRAV